LKGKPFESVIIEARKVTKQFPGVLALNRVDLRVYAGKVNAVVGENGAGKSTLMNILSGVYTDYDGELVLNGEHISFKDTDDARQRGISIIHQELQLIPHLSIAENIFLGREPLNRAGLIDYKKMEEKAGALLERLDFITNVKRKIVSLRIGQRQIVEIAKALSFDVRVLIMDEPTSALSESETSTLFKLIDSLKAKGTAIVYITHKMNELIQLADTVTVLRDGCSVCESTIKNVSVNDIVKLMVGRDVKDFYVKQSHEMGDVRLKIENMSLKETGASEKFRLQDISFDVKESEVLGIYGLMGSGRTELFETILGLHKPQTSGTIYIKGKQIQITRPNDAVQAGIALIPEDRKNDGLVLNMTMAENISLASLSQILRKGLLSENLEQAQSDQYRQKLNIKSYSSNQEVVTLSGGNQQKVVVSKWLAINPVVLLLDEPTRGIDVNAKNEIYKIMDSLASQGMAIVIVSSELPEIMAISDRIMTICGGRFTGEFERKSFAEEKILHAALPNQ